MPHNADPVQSAAMPEVTFQNEVAASSDIPAPAAPPASTSSPRLVSLDAFRGFVMILMVSAGLGIHGMVASFAQKPEWRHLKTPLWDWLAYHTDHAPWAGVAFWDMIQPWFMFMVGAALPFSIANRKAKGQSFGRMLAHAAFRAVALILLSIFLISYGRHTSWVFTNVLAQIGLGYFFLFLAAWLKRAGQWVAALTILVLSWGAFALYPAPPANLDLKSVDLPPDWPRLTGFAAHWEKNTNLAARADQWFLNLFSQYDNRGNPAPFRFSSGGYQTLNFVPSLATMIFGLIAGGILRGGRPPRARFRLLIALGAGGLALGWALGWLGVCPVIKRIWTPSWALFAAGWSFLTLGLFYRVIDIGGYKTWAFPLIVVGMNSIAIYCMSMRLKPWVRETMQRHFGADVYNVFGAPYAPMAEAGFFLLFCWLVCWWMYRRKIFLRI